MSKSPNTTKSPTNTSPTRGIRGRRGPPRGRAPTRSRPMSQNIPNLRGNFRPNRITSRNPNSSLNTNQNTNTNPINKTEETNPNTKQKVANVFKSKFEEQKKIRFPQKKPIAKKQNNLPGKLNPNKLDPAKLMAQALMGSPKSIQKIHANKLKEEKKKAKKEKKIKSKEKNANENKTEKTQDQEEKLKPKKITEQEVEKMHVQTLTISTKSEETEPKQISETNKRGEDMYLLFKSEKEFLSQLETFLNNYQIPLSQSAEIANSNYAEKALVKVEPLIEQQKLIVDKLTSLMKENISINERSVGKCYSDFKTEVYEMWVDQYDEAMHNSTLLREEVAEASDLFHKCQEQCDNKNYDFFLAEPLRRINSLYQEIRTLLLHTDVEKQDYARLYNFLNKIEPVLYQTAPRLYVIEHQAELLALEETIENRGKIRIAQNGPLFAYERHCASRN
ncbi:hypothetical protein M0811_14651 [Anaeramoeba ignava]|uniref:DH domain-containing protein n=1 Tax=Anaeramoeba ignava TaxID=1746090 RepID=A0A9Q0LUU7_ANAIG|nr:hypothetical protein M0811_14651 [Anaeramoeba ignava]